MSQVPTWNPETFIELRSYREVEEVLRRGRDFVVSGTKAESDEFVHGTLLAIDGPEHLARRRALMKMIKPNQPWGPQGHLVDEVFDHNLRRVMATVAPHGGAYHFDLIEFSRRIVWRVTAVLVGLDNVDDDDQVIRFIGLAAPVLSGLVVEYAAKEQRDAILVAARQARAQIREELFEPSLARRRALLKSAHASAAAVDDLPADLLTSMLVAAGDAELDDEMIFREAIALLAAAINNPVSQLTWALDDILPWLETHPENRSRLGEREFLNLAVKETLRLHRASRPHLVRIAVADTVLESTGRFIPGGSWVSSWVQQADRDPATFGPDADTYNPYRTPIDPSVTPFGVAFGAGPHVCLGRPMLLWEQGDESAQGMQTKLLRLLLANNVCADPDGIQELVGEAGGRRYARYDVIMPVTGAEH